MATLEALDLKSDAPEGVNLRRCYAAMVDGGFLRSAEMDQLECWVADCAKVAQRAGVTGASWGMA